MENTGLKKIYIFLRRALAIDKQKTHDMDNFICDHRTNFSLKRRLSAKFAGTLLCQVDVKENEGAYMRVGKQNVSQLK